MIWGLWRCIILLEVHQKMVYCGHKGMDMVSNNTQVDCGLFKQCLIGTKGPKCAKKISPTALHHHQQPEPLRQGRMIHAFMFFTPNSDPIIWMSQQIETHRTRQRFFNLLSSNFGESVWIVSSVCCSYLTGAAPGVVFCCWSPSASGFDVLCVQRWYSSHLGCNEWLFELLLSFYHL